MPSVWPHAWSRAEYNKYLLSTVPLFFSSNSLPHPLLSSLFHQNIYYCNRVIEVSGPAHCIVPCQFPGFDVISVQDIILEELDDGPRDLSAHIGNYL